MDTIFQIFRCIFSMRVNLPKICITSGKFHMGKGRRTRRKIRENNKGILCPIIFPPVVTVVIWGLSRHRKTSVFQQMFRGTLKQGRQQLLHPQAPWRRSKFRLWWLAFQCARYLPSHRCLRSLPIAGWSENGCSKEKSAPKQNLPAYIL